jgi:hypothetical protein
MSSGNKYGSEVAHPLRQSSMEYETAQKGLSGRCRQKRGKEDLSVHLSFKSLFAYAYLLQFVASS